MTEILVETITPPVQEITWEEAGVVTEYEVAPLVEEMILEVPGPAGPLGPQGNPGPPGPSGDDYVFEQDTPSDNWVVTHNLGRYPIVGSVIDSTGQAVGTEIFHDSVNQFRSLSDGAMTGRVPYS